jgi:hypothetical protein
MTTTALAAWRELNDRQQGTLRVIHDLDQEREVARKIDAANGYWDSSPAAVWRRIDFAHDPSDRRLGLDDRDRVVTVVGDVGGVGGRVDRRGRRPFADTDGGGDGIGGRQLTPIARSSSMSGRRRTRVGCAAFGHAALRSAAPLDGKPGIRAVDRVDGAACPVWRRSACSARSGCSGDPDDLRRRFLAAGRCHGAPEPRMLSVGDESTGSAASCGLASAR